MSSARHFLILASFACCGQFALGAEAESVVYKRVAGRELKLVIDKPPE